MVSSLKDVVAIEKILRSMTPKYDYVVCSIEEYHDLDSLSIDERVQSSLLVHEQRMGRHAVDEQVLKVTHESQSGGRGGRGGSRGRGRGRGRSGGFDKSIIECYNCHELGHFQWECSKKGKDTEANFTETSEEMLLMAYVDVEDEDDNGECWFLDSGCSNHMCGKKEIFSELDENFRDVVKFGNDLSLAVMGKGNVRIKVPGFILVLSRFFYVPELKNNLLSLGQLQEKGLAILIQHGKCTIYHIYWKC